MKTQTAIEYSAIDVTAKSDSSYNASNKQSFSDLDKLKLDKLKETKYATFEKNFFILNGESKLMPENVSVAYWSKYISDENGALIIPPVLTITFSESVHSSLGLTFKFSEYSYCTKLLITYYNSSNEIISSETFYPDSYNYFCEQVVSNYKKITIQFQKTNLPYRYIKLYEIIFGQILRFDGEELMNANLLEQVNLLSDELTINTLDFVVYTDDDKFNILNPVGVYKTLQERQSANAYMIVNNQTRDMGTFYLDTWESENDNKMKFSAIDLVGLLDKSDFDGGMYSNVTVENLIGNIMTSAGLTSEFYEIENALKNIQITGYIPICTHREALQQILFSIGALANCGRSDKINIYRVSETQNPNMIYKSNVLKGSRKIEQGKIVTGVSVIAHKYRQGTQQDKLFEGNVGAGVHKITFDEPVHDLTCTGGTITSSGANFAIVETSSSGEITINGYKYIHDTQNFLVQDSELTENEKPNILKIDKDYLINSDNALDIANRILDYYKNSYITEFNFILDDEKPADNVTIEENFGNILNGYVTELDIDMTGGYITKGKVVAKVSEANG